MIEQFFQCPYCFEQVSILVDPSIYDQSFIEDCEVCCNPIEFIVRSSGSSIHEFSAQKIGQ